MNRAVCGTKVTIIALEGSLNNGYKLFHWCCHLYLCACCAYSIMKMYEHVHDKEEGPVSFLLTYHLKIGNRRLWLQLHFQIKLSTVKKWAAQGCSPDLWHRKVTCFNQLQLTCGSSCAEQVTLWRALLATYVTNLRPWLGSMLSRVTRTQAATRSHSVNIPTQLDDFSPPDGSIVLTTTYHSYQYQPWSMSIKQSLSIIANMYEPLLALNYGWSCCSTFRRTNRGSQY